MSDAIFNGVMATIVLVLSILGMASSAIPVAILFGIVAIVAIGMLYNAVFITSKDAF